MYISNEAWRLYDKYWNSDTPISVSEAQEMVEDQCHSPREWMAYLKYKDKKLLTFEETILVINRYNGVFLNRTLK